MSPQHAHRYLTTVRQPERDRLAAAVDQPNQLASGGMIAHTVPVDPRMPTSHGANCIGPKKEFLQVALRSPGGPSRKFTALE